MPRLTPPHSCRVLVAAALALCSTTPAWAKGSKPASAHGRRASNEKEREPKSPPSLRLELLDLQAGRAVVLVGGVTRAPGPRLFVFHDDRERHFVALDASCEPVPPEEPPAPEPLAAPARTRAPDAEQDPRPVAGTAAPGDDELQRCVLALPRPYLRGHVTSFTVRVRGREVAADDAAVRALFAAAREGGPVRAPPPALPMTSPQAPPIPPAVPGVGAASAATGPGGAGSTATSTSTASPESPPAAVSPAPRGEGKDPRRVPSRADDEELDVPGSDDPGVD